MSASADQIKRMEELQVTLKEAADAYYNRDIEIMSNYEYDALYDELLALEEETGVILEDSITQGVGAEVVSELPKVEHSEPMLSLGKTKSRDELVSWLGEREGCLSYKLDLNQTFSLKLWLIQYIFLRFLYRSFLYKSWQSLHK